MQSMDVGASTHDIRMAVEIGHLEGLLYHVLARYRAAQEAGELPGDADRKPPAADHAIVWCVDAHDIVGFATFYDVDLERLWLDVLWVDPRHRRRGIAKALLTAVRERSSASYRIMLGTDVDNAAMRRLAESFGARQTVAQYEIAPREPVL